MEVGVEVLKELCKNGRRNGSFCEDRSSFMGIMKLNRSHIERRIYGEGGHAECIVVGRIRI